MKLLSIGYNEVIKKWLQKSMRNLVHFYIFLVINAGVQYQGLGGLFEGVQKGLGFKIGMSKISEKLFHPSSEIAMFILGLCALGSVLVYGLVFIPTANLLAAYTTPDIDLLRILSTDKLAEWRLLLGFALLSGMYVGGWKAAKKVKIPTRDHWYILLGGAFVAALVLMYLYPIDATDIFDNIIHGRILTIHGGNPFYDLAANYPQDPFYKYAGWLDAPSAYGPAWELLAGIAARLAGNGIVANVLLFKLLPGIFLIGCVVVVMVFLRQAAPERALAGTWLIAWNPLVLYETFGMGHNDIVMTFWIAGAVWMLYQGRHTRAALFLVVGALFKFVSVLLLPAAGLIALRSLPTWKARVHYLITSAVGSLLLSVLFFAPFWRGTNMLTLSRREHMFTTSLPSIVYHYLIPIAGEGTAAIWVSRVAAGLLLAFTLWQAWRAGEKVSPNANEEINRANGWLAFTRASLLSLIFYLLVSVLWFQQWYGEWLVPLAAILPGGLLQGVSLWIGITGMLKTLVIGPYVFLKRPLDPLPLLELKLTTGVMALPWLGSLWALWKSTRKREKVKYGYDQSRTPAA